MEALFRTLRETMGMEQSWVGRQLQVDRRTLSRWESVSPMTPPQFAEDWIREWWGRYAGIVADTLDMVAEQAEARGGDPEKITLSRFPSEESYRRAHPDDAMTWRMHSALVGLIAFSLELDGYEVEVNWAPTENG